MSLMVSFAVECKRGEKLCRDKKQLFILSRRNLVCLACLSLIHIFSFT